MRRILPALVLPLMLALYSGAAPHPEVPETDPLAAVGELWFDLGTGRSVGGSATVVGPRRADGKWDVLTAGHVVNGSSGKGSFILKDGQKLAVTAVSINTRCDVCWMTTDRNDLVDLPFATVARNDPVEGTGVWICGYGNRKEWKGIRRDGVVAPGGLTLEGQLRFRIDIDHGDSGGGIFRSDNNELVGVASWHDHPGSLGLVGGGAGPSFIRPGRPR